ncbi:MAG: M28 family peptidase [Bacteroidetes bacterium]|jgi:hypothetical protein|nr:M28 family peptidase [Bacteroidota bacterium]
MTSPRLLRNALFALLVGVLLVGCAPTDTIDSDAVPADAPAGTPPTTVAPALVQQYQQQIAPEDLAAQVYYLSGNHFKGRDTGTPQLRQAATYLATQYQMHGVAPAGTMPTDDPRAPERYFQPVELFGFEVTRAHLSARHAGAMLHEAVYRPDGSDGSVLPLFGNRPESTGGVVFGGYGIADAALGYDDFAALAEAGIDLEGQWLILLRDEPMDADGTRLLTDDGAPSEWTRGLNQKLRRAFGSGPPAGVLVVGDSGPEPVDIPARVQDLASVNAPVQVSTREQPLQQNVPPVYMVDTAFADTLLGTAERSVAEVRSAIQESRAPQVFSLPEVTLASTLTHTPVAVTSQNVLGYVEGSDPALKDELIVITSHYDHTGLSPAGPAGNYINNGADDNATGTVGTLAMAAAFQAAARDGVGPRRSILFMNVTAEERGLLGSAYYADIDPVFPIEQTVLNINMDMIGRIDPSSPTLPDSNYVYIIGGDLISDDLHEANQQANALTGLNLTLSDRYNDPDGPQQLFRRSDQWNFGKYNIPFIFYFTGLHEDYHDVGDTADKIDYERMADIVRLAFGTVWEIANQDEPPAVTGEEFD